MRFFIDTHDRTQGTFPEQIDVAGFEGFYAQYLEACRAEGVVPLRTHLSYEDGRAFCFNMAADAEAVKRAHERVGLPYDEIIEVTTATPGDTFFRAT
jgi:hypothetical protein